MRITDEAIDKIRQMIERHNTSDVLEAAVKRIQAGAGHPILVRCGANGAGLT